LIKGGLLCGLLFFSAHFAGQERFNIRYPSQFPSTLLTNIIEVEEGYLVTGIAGEYVGIQSRPTVTALFGSIGDLAYETTFGSAFQQVSEKTYASENGDITYLNDNTLVMSSGTYGIDSLSQACIIFMNLSGDTTSTFRFDSPHKGLGYPLDYVIQPKRVVVSSDGHLIIQSGIIGEDTGNDFMIQKRTITGELLWTYFYSTEADPDSNYALIPNDDGGAYIVPRLVTGIYPPLQHRMIELNENGEMNLLFETALTYRSGSIFHAFWDNEFLVGAAKRENGNPDETTPGIIKLDNEGNVIFHTALWSDTLSDPETNIRVHKATDGNYVVGGYKTKFHSVLTDSLGDRVEQAYLSKVNSTSGEPMWTNYYQFFDLPAEKQHMYDMRPTSDGGFIFCGQAMDLWQQDDLTEPPYQQGWIVKVDQDGCLVEGCYVGMEEELALESKYFKAGPNPASQFLNIFQAQQLSNDAQYQVYDLSGRLIHQG
jgi:hypothetical protein